MTQVGSVLVVGASAAGLATAEALRRKGYQGALTVIGGEFHPPYDRPPLSKQVLAGEWVPERAQLRTADQLAALDAEIVLQDPARSLDTAARTVRTASGRAVRADAVVIATGLRSRAFPGQQSLEGVHTLRSLDDALALRSALQSADRTVVIGDGVLGAEIAATARGMGVDVTLVGMLTAPMVGLLGSRMAARLAQLHTDRGVHMEFGVAVEFLQEERGRVTAVGLADGRVLPARTVVVAIGSVPATDWLTDSGLTVADGVVCDAFCQAADGVYAVGDVARWHHRGLGKFVRWENRTNANEQAAAVAANILGENRPYTPVPYMWTDQFDAKIQAHGLLGEDADVQVVEGSEEDGRFVALYRRDGHMTGVLGWNMPKQARLHRAAVVDHYTAQAALHA
ncbi:NAD(P)/FAD-dependent oxidoreductase [Streptomyces fuscichromogenes]|uniref:Pyridine nucleotide-disulfide oxidoreductase n=1 Tax=Streptomyces fuscichromogenes TaxID=1324013 RepID=A0A917X9W2_9ACTN|nr:FAD-dependent oxidoreductase [Streptomyces fuscichromogenes]GGM98611.1 pyridine nucleotide-disulfide oxidoreductase [Streptomyces fuscichromogenes]